MFSQFHVQIFLLFFQFINQVSLILSDLNNRVQITKTISYSFNQLNSKISYKNSVAQIKTDTMEKEKTAYSSLYNGFLTAKDNYVWAGAMCLAWTQFKNSIIKAPIDLAAQDQNALRMINNFNSDTFKQSDINPACVYIKSGFGKKTLDLINKQVKQKFPEKTMAPLNIPMQDDSIISYAYLLKKLEFLAQFQRLPDKNLTFNKDLNVDAFYANSKQHRKQIQYVQFQDNNNFVVCIKSKNPKDLLFLVKSESHLKLQNIMQKCQQKHLKAIGNKDEFMMPVVQFNLKRSYQQLKLGVKNKGFTDYHIQEMFQNIKIKIDQSGAKVQNEAVMVMNRCLPMHFQQIKQFILDQPFWIIMKQQGKHPYLAIYVRNPIQTQ